MNFGPIDLEAAEIFAISNGKIHEIEAVSLQLEDRPGIAPSQTPSTSSDCRRRSFSPRWYHRFPCRWPPAGKGRAVA
jgi:hypothetical protein